MYHIPKGIRRKGEFHVKCLRTWDCVPQFNSLELKTTTVGYAVAADASEWALPDFTAPFSKLYFVLNGSITAGLLQPDGTTDTVYTLTPGKVWVLPCGNHYDLSTPAGFEKYYLHISLPARSGIDLFSGVRQVWGAPFDMDKWAFAQTEEAGWSFALKAKLLALEAVGLLTEAADNPVLAQNLYEQSHFPPALQTAIRYIRENISARLTVEETADACRITASQLRRLFHDALGMSPKTYLSDRLYERAGELLLTEHVSVKEVAAALKFADLYAFSRFWKRYTGYSPTAYREMNR